MKKLLSLSILCILVFTGCTKAYESPKTDTTTPVIKVNGITYTGYRLLRLQTEEVTDYYRITALAAGNPGNYAGNIYQVWFGVKPENVTIEGISNSANVPAVFLEKDHSGIFTGHFFIQIPPGYPIGKFVN